MWVTWATHTQWTIGDSGALQYNICEALTPHTCVPSTQKKHTDQVVRLSPSGEDVRSTLTLQPAKNDGTTGVALALHDVDASPEALAAGGAAGGVVTSGRPCPAPPALSSRVAMVRVTRVRCLTSSDGGESLTFAILAAAAINSGGGHGEEGKFSLDDAPGPNEMRGAFDGRSERREGNRLHEAEEMEPFGVLRTTSGENFCALVLGVASVK